MITDDVARSEQGEELGLYAFANARSYEARVPLEVDTAREKELFLSLKRAFEGSVGSEQEGVSAVALNEDDAELIMGFLRRGIYKDVFRAPRHGTIVYRGMLVPRAWLTSAGLTADEIVDVETLPQFKKKAAFEFGPRRGASSSWTLDYGIAEGFAVQKAEENWRETGVYCLVLCARADDNPYSMLVGPNGLYNVKQFNVHSHEKEVICLGPVRVSEIRAWVEI